MFAEYTVFGVRVLVGVNVAEEPVWVTVPPIDLTKLAYFFEGRYECHSDDALAAAHGELMQAFDEWRAVYRPNSLLQFRGPVAVHPQGSF